jgi:hypothetical protein
MSFRHAKGPDIRCYAPAMEPKNFRANQKQCARPTAIDPGRSDEKRSNGCKSGSKRVEHVAHASKINVWRTMCSGLSVRFPSGIEEMRTPTPRTSAAHHRISGRRYLRARAKHSERVRARPRGRFDRGSPPPPPAARSGGPRHPFKLGKSISEGRRAKLVIARPARVPRTRFPSNYSDLENCFSSDFPGLPVTAFSTRHRRPGALRLVRNSAHSETSKGIDT